ncbi:MAG: hypothetical protein ACOCXA_09040 [Planctomycetota bacterium]
MDLTDNDVAVLRGLAERVAEAAADPIQEQRRQAWKAHNALQPGRPLLVCDIEPPMWREIIPPERLACSNEFARFIENELLYRLYHIDVIHDDWVQQPYFHLPLIIDNSGFGVETRSVDTGHSFGAKHFDPVIVEERDIERIVTPTIAVDWELNKARQQALNQAFGDLLPVHLRGFFVPWFAPLDQFAEWRGIENLMMDLLDDPDWLHEAMERLCVAHLGMLDQMQALDAISLNNDSHFVGSGGMGFTDELPQPDFDGEHVRPQDLWGQAAAQIFSEVSPAMHEEFALPYDKRWLERFGLGCYGCCEPLHRKIDVLRQIPNLRRISMSPWVDVAEGAKNIGRDYIFSRKPNPAILASERWQPDLARRNIRADLEASAGCVVEFIMKDTCTCRDEPHRVTEWTDIVMEECRRFAEAGLQA